MVALSVAARGAVGALALGNCLALKTRASTLAFLRRTGENSMGVVRISGLRWCASRPEKAAMTGVTLTGGRWRGAQANGSNRRMVNIWRFASGAVFFI